MDGGAWWAIVHGVAKSRTQLSNFTFTFDTYICICVYIFIDHSIYNIKDNHTISAISSILINLAFQTLFEKLKFGHLKTFQN